MELYFKIKTVLLIGSCVLSVVSLGIMGAVWIGRVIHNRKFKKKHHIAGIGKMASVKEKKMIKIEDTRTIGFDVAIHGMRNPMNSWDKNDSLELFRVGQHGLQEAGSNHRALSVC